MKIIRKELGEYSKKELQDERFELSSTLIDAGINPDLRQKHRKDRQRECADHKYELERIIIINELLGETGDRNDMYNGFLQDAIGGFD